MLQAKPVCLLLSCLMSVALLGVLVLCCPDMVITPSSSSQGLKGETAAGDSVCLYCNPLILLSRSC